MDSLKRIAVERTVIEAQKVLSIVECYHAPIRATDRNILMECPKTDINIALAMVAKAINETMEQDGIFRWLLLFGELLRTFPRLIRSCTHINRTRQH